MLTTKAIFLTRFEPYLSGKDIKPIRSRVKTIVLVCSLIPGLMPLVAAGFAQDENGAVYNLIIFVYMIFTVLLIWMLAPMVIVALGRMSRALDASMAMESQYGSRTDSKLPGLKRRLAIIRHNIFAIIFVTSGLIVMYVIAATWGSIPFGYVTSTVVCALPSIIGARFARFFDTEERGTSGVKQRPITSPRNVQTHE
jgi:hypothetical protein